MRAPALAEKSPVAIAIQHFAMGITALGGASALALGGVQLWGDSDAANPSVEMALFSKDDAARPLLKTRLSNALSSEEELANADAEPSLPGVAYDEGLDAADAANASFTVTEVSEGPATKPHVNPLPKAPIAAVQENGPHGSVPKIAANGMTPAQAYARPFTPTPGVPRISLVVGGLGLKDSHTMAAIRDLPPEVTLSFVPYSNNLQTYINRAREAGHEVMLEMPMEAYDYPNVDTGPETLLTSANADENVRRTQQLLGRATGYFGLINYQGAKFATDLDAAKPVFASLAARGVAFVHDGAAARSALPDAARATKLPFRVADRIVDAEPTADSIDRQLLQLEALAVQNGQAVGVGFAYPVTIEQFKIWADSLKAKGYQLAPVSASVTAPARTAAAPAASAHAPAAGAAKH
jgi:polysaccharide deacetylase 2 family uncharacterized protein YibQ